MTLTPGTRFGPYEVLSPLGAGGMGEVWRATDTRLGRDVALKLLPAAFASDPDRLARFEREAKLLASLSHTHIAGLFALEEATVDGAATPVRFLAMELAEGEDLAERLKRGAIPVDEAIAIAKQIAEALEAAHEKGIVHCDLKPANVKVSADGHVKVLDFGLAKAWSGDGDGAIDSADGSLSPTLARVSWAPRPCNAPIHWMDREGKTTPLRAAPAYWGNPAFSPDGRRLALQINDGKQGDVWIYEWARDTLTRFTDHAADDGWPVWTPDGRRIAFSSTRAGTAIFNLYWQRADGTGEVERLTESQNMQWATSFHPSGKLLAFSEYEPEDFDVMMLPIEGDEASGWKPGKPASFVSDASLSYTPMFSPDGHWLAYTFSETGRHQVYARPFPGPGGKSPISTQIGFHPVWSRTRSELLFGAVDQSFSHARIMVAPYTVEGDSFVAEKPRLWYEGSFGRPRGLEWRPYDLHPDGERLALAPPAETEGGKQDKLILVFNFFDALRRMAPVEKR